jgi:hypothetical protein
MKHTDLHEAYTGKSDQWDAGELALYKLEKARTDNDQASGQASEPASQQTAGEDVGEEVHP